MQTARRNLKTQLIFTIRPNGCTLIRHKTKLFENAVQRSKLTKSSIVCMWTENILKIELFEFDNLTIIM